ncbi:hypothetical protein C7212DRAFT_355230 [Tuber magnatum]|uniref:Cora-domain-containing protein n=1 Tax=Tuber magnatum TaxID=42249 RepID=A0A317SXK7_9PEZI|nr:hypothetical protein C7212DRAFT_355230 [Tuber magnatum]
MADPQPARWETIGGQQEFYDERDCLHPGHNLTSEKLRGRGQNEVVIFEYLLNPGYLSRGDGDPEDEDGDSSSGAESDVFFRVSKDELMESHQFDQVIDPTGKPIEPVVPRLGIIDFLECYDTSDENLLNMMAERLHLPSARTFRDAHLTRLEALSGHREFRTGISLLAPSKSSKSTQSEDKFSLFVSYPYFGESDGKIDLDARSESVRLSDFRRLGAHDGAGPRWGRTEKAEVLVHQARYMIFDNYTMAAFRSKEDSAEDKVPLHRFQERIGAFRAVVHMIANRMGLELSTLRKLQASLCKLEEDIDQMISDAETYEDNQGMEVIAEDPATMLGLLPGTTLTPQQVEDYEQARKDNVQREKQRRVRRLLASLNSLSAALFAAMSVAERQIAVLEDLHSVFLTSHRRKTKDRNGGRQNPFHKSIALIPILLENREQIWPNTLDTIDEVVQERKTFIEKIKGLVENMDIRRKILSGFLKSEQAKAAPSERTAQETTQAMKDTKDAIEETQKILVQQMQTLSGFTIVTTAFLPLSFCTSYYGMSNIKDHEKKYTLRDFWLATGPVLVGILLLTLIVVYWKRPEMVGPKKYVKEKKQWKYPRLKDIGNRGRKVLFLQ